MKVSEAFPSKYLKAADIPAGREAVVTILGVSMESIDDNDNPKPTLYFHGKSKGFVLNRTNPNTLAQAFGDEMGDWVGRRIAIFATTTLFRGTRTPCLRCRALPAPAPAGFPPPRPPETTPAMAPGPARPAIDGEPQGPPATDPSWAGDDIPF